MNIDVIFVTKSCFLNFISEQSEKHGTYTTKKNITLCKGESHVLFKPKQGVYTCLGCHYNYLKHWNIKFYDPNQLNFFLIVSSCFCRDVLYEYSVHLYRQQYKMIIENAGFMIRIIIFILFVKYKLSNISYQVLFQWLNFVRIFWRLVAITFDLSRDTTYSCLISGDESSCFCARNKFAGSNSRVSPPSSNSTIIYIEDY